MTDTLSHAAASLVQALHRSLTIDDLPVEDLVGHTELIDGSLLITPDADFGHQFLVGELFVVIRSRLRGDQRLTATPGGNVIVDDSTLVIPDIVVADRTMLTRNGLGCDIRGTTYVVEISSPSTRRYDLTLKRSLYEEFGVAYSTVDRKDGEPFLTNYGDMPSYALTQADIDMLASP